MNHCVCVTHKKQQQQRTQKCRVTANKQIKSVYQRYMYQQKHWLKFISVFTLSKVLIPQFGAYPLCAGCTDICYSIECIRDEQSSAYYASTVFNSIGKPVYAFTYNR